MSSSSSLSSVWSSAMENTRRAQTAVPLTWRAADGWTANGTCLGRSFACFFALEAAFFAAFLEVGAAGGGTRAAEEAGSSFT
jgi:hypothetical protein